jgi:hypothetical protein
MGVNEKPLKWRKSSFSQNGDCIELAHDRACVYVRDSKNAASGELRFTYAEWREFAEAVKVGKAGLAHH